MKVLVTGGAGYIGSHTVRELAQRGHEVAVIDTLEFGSQQMIAGIPFYQGSITDAAFLDQTFQAVQPAAVIHFAAYKAPGESMQEPVKYFQNNIGGTLTLLDTMLHHRVNSIVFSSSCSIFGTPRQLPVSEDAATAPASVYGETKLMGETMLRWFDQTKGLKYNALRYFNAAGASLDAAIGENWTRTGNLIPLTMKAAFYNTPVTVFGTDYPTPDGTAIRDYIHVVDLAIAHVVAVEHLVETQQSTAYNLGVGKGYSVQEVINAAKRISGIDFPVEYGPRRAGDPEAIVADCRKAERELGWHAQYSSLDTILETAWRWHSSHPDGVNKVNA
ncbi:MAG TPA: UDP-glucose 4-epimerase GalE [Ktedonobacteraceae bacterium]|jgi:UDP-glucose 4-epimerase|nr:UDP-glucose 4-epimerase GalE [Ktedonobacteraceae bacterium]